MCRRDATRLVILLFSMVLFVLCYSTKSIYKEYSYSVINDISIVSLRIGVIGLLFLTMEVLFSNKIYKGVRYCFWHMYVKHSLERQMIDAGMYIQRGEYIEVPRIRIEFDKNMRGGTLKVENSIKFDKKLDDVVLTSALKKFVVERHYLTDDGNYYVYEFLDGSISFKLDFKSIEDFREYNSQIPLYKIFLDKRSVVNLQHTLIVGVTGSGKTYCLYNILLQFVNKRKPYVIYFADPKGSSLAVLGNKIAPDKTAVDMADIIDKLEEFVLAMQNRKKEIAELLRGKLDADYSTFRKTPYIFCFDEYASFVSVLANEDKKTRDKVNALMSEVILQGRQLGFFMLIIMQKSDANLISTSLRDNIPLKLVLGNSEQQTYVTAFGTGIDVPNRHYKVGEGVFTEPVIAPTPKIVQCPSLKFDILKSFKMATPVM